MPKRIQRQRTRGWRMPDDAVYVGRPTRWGNPFTVADAIAHGFADNDADADARKVCVETFAAWLDGDVPSNTAETEERRQWILANLPSLAGKTLACWCPESQPCHADTLLAAANPGQED